MDCVLIGICGGTGSGKTTVATKIVAGLPPGRAVLLQQDSYYHDRSHLTPDERSAINFDEPDALENSRLANDLRQIKAGTAIHCPEYDFATHTRRRETRLVPPAPFVIVEGILLFCVPVLRDLFDLRLFVDTPDDVRLLRRIKRDLLERGRDIESVESQYLSTVRAMHELHVAPTKKFAHLIIPQDGENDRALDVIIGRLLHLLAR